MLCGLVYWVSFTVDVLQPMVAAAVPSALLAPSAYSPMLTDATASTLFAFTAYSPMLTDATPSTLLAPTALPSMLTNAASSTLLARTAYSPMLTDTTASTLLALAALPPVLARHSMESRFYFSGLSHLPRWVYMCVETHPHTRQQTWPATPLDASVICSQA